MNSVVPGRYWSALDDGRVVCELCPRLCKLKDGQRGFCFVRQNVDGGVVLTTYGRSSGFCVDPIEKKPLNHFYPGTGVLSFGTAGCNLACRFCQNWSISKSRETDTLADAASPRGHRQGRRGFRLPQRRLHLQRPGDLSRVRGRRRRRRVASDGIATVAVTAGEILAEPRAEFFAHMDAANVDLKAFTDRFYKKLCGGELQPVLETLEYLVHETDVWVELTTLLIPGENDSARRDR